MGGGSYTGADWRRLRESRKLSTAATSNQIFKRTEMDQRFDPKFINIREARDSEEHPDSTPIIIGLDVTGSMGYLATQIAKESLNETMMKLYSTGVVPDPQLMFAAIGDVIDRAPLQVTQFESDIRIGEQLLDLWLENRGGDAPEDFELLWYFAAKHTSIDSFEKRGKKGFIITIGDADVHTDVTGDNIAKIFNDSKFPYSSKRLLKMAQEKYEVFHINIAGRSSLNNFKELLPGHIASVDRNEINRLPEIIISIIQLSLGDNLDKVLDQWDALTKPVVLRAVRDLDFSKQKKKGFFF